MPQPPQDARLGLDQVESPANEVRDSGVRRGGFVGWCSGKLFDLPLEIRATSGQRPGGAAAEVVVNLVASDGPQPAAETADRRVVAKVASDDQSRDLKLLLVEFRVAV